MSGWCQDLPNNNFHSHNIHSGNSHRTPNLAVEWQWARPLGNNRSAPKAPMQWYWWMAITLGFKYFMRPIVGLGVLIFLGYNISKSQEMLPNSGIRYPHPSVFPTANAGAIQPIRVTSSIAQIKRQRFCKIDARVYAHIPYDSQFTVSNSHVSRRV